MLARILAAGTFALILAQASAQQSPQVPEVQQPEKQSESVTVGLPVYSSDGQKLGEVTDVGTAGGKQAVRVEMGQFLGLGSSPVLVGADAFQKKGDRLELSMTAAQVREELVRQRKGRQEQN